MSYFAQSYVTDSGFDPVLKIFVAVSGVVHEAINSFPSPRVMGLARSLIIEEIDWLCIFQIYFKIYLNAYNKTCDNRIKCRMVQCLSGIHSCAFI